MRIPTLEVIADQLISDGHYDLATYLNGKASGLSLDQEKKFCAAIESVFDNGDITLCMADVQHMERRGNGNLMVIMKSTTWNNSAGDYNNAIFIPNEKVQEFKSAWLTFRTKIEQETLKVAPGCDVSRSSAMIQS